MKLEKKKNIYNEAQENPNQYKAIWGEQMKRVEI